MDNIIQKAAQDLKLKEAQTAKLQEEIQELKAFIRLAEKYSAGGAEPEKAKRRVVYITPTAEGTKKYQILGFSKKLLADGTPRTTRTILAELKAAGIEVGGASEADEVMNLSGYLSREKEVFQTDRIKGWSLKTSGPESVDAQSGPRS